ncbi:hypothetical protein YFHUAIHA_CDS0174 [Phage C48C1]|nr:hypothetical protein YFHUAIHA_CDS0174 [Phage C48C1]
MLYDYDSIVNQLRSNVLEVSFVKVDGDTRVMPCTLLTEYMPEPSETKVQKVDDYSVNKSVIRAFAIDKQAWRSFRLENVTGVRVVNA